MFYHNKYGSSIYNIFKFKFLFFKYNFDSTQLRLKYFYQKYHVVINSYNNFSDHLVHYFSIIYIPDSKFIKVNNIAIFFLRLVLS